MAILTINGVAVAAPNSMSISISDLSSEETGRNLAGKMQKDVIARKTTLDLEWPCLNWSETSELLTEIEKSIFMSVRYPDPKAGNYVTKTMYVGDRKAPALCLVDGKEKWEGISFTLIEQ